MRFFRKMTWKITFIVGAMIVLITGTTAIYMETLLLSEIGERSRLNLRYQVAEISAECNFAFMEAVYNVQSMRHFTEANFDVEMYINDAEYYFSTRVSPVMDGFVYNIIDSSEFISAAYFAVNPNLTPDPYVREVYFVSTGNGILPEEPQTYEEYMQADSEEMEWFYGPYNSGGPYWSHVYRWTDGTVMVSYTEPVYAGGAIIGIVGADITIGHIKDLIQDIRLYDTGFALLKDGYNIFFETNDIIQGLDQGERNRLNDTARLNGSGTFDIELGGVSYIAAAHYLENGYCIYFLVPAGEINSEAMASLLIFAAAFGAALAIVLIIAYCVGKIITKPILKLTEDAALIGGGKLDHVLEVKTGDELELLSDAFNAMIGSVKEITAEKERTDERAKAAHEASQLKSRFLATMSHEIRTPMNAILGVAEIELLNELLDPAARAAFEKIHISGDMLLGIINDILDLSKIEAGKLELLIGKYEIASLISDTAQLNVMRIGGKPIEFELYVDQNVPSEMSGDELRVKQILNNLLSNAFKYTASGTVTMRVSSEESAERGGEVTLIISVSDTGQGMTEEQVASLFDEYTQFNQEANRLTEGTGLGMNITWNLIQMMNGSISVESELGKGSTFTVFLPHGKTDAEPLGREMADSLHGFRTFSKVHMRRSQISRDRMPYGSVLVVDDVETNIYVARGLMTPYELKIDSAQSGSAAIEKIKDGNVYDIVFMDHMMPVMDGIETTKLLREMGYQRPVVALTANAVAGQADVFLENGFDGFLSKPIDIRQLNKILNTFIRDRQPPEVVETVRMQTASKPAPGDDAQQPALDPKFAGIVARDVEKSLEAIGGIVAKAFPYSEDDLRTYVIHVHGMKSALAGIKRLDLSFTAARLEHLGRLGDFESIADETPGFLEGLRAVIEALAPKDDHADEPADEDAQYLRERLLEIKAACGEYDENTAEKALAQLADKAWTRPTGEFLNAVSGHLLHSDFDEIVKIIDEKLR